MCIGCMHVVNIANWLVFYFFHLKNYTFGRKENQKMWLLKHESRLVFALSLLVLMRFCNLVQGARTPQEIRCPVQSLYQLGDSVADTGNVIRLFPTNPASLRPYGETFPGYPTGRCSNGHLIIDYIAIALGLPLLNPYMAKNASFDTGVNFAVAGSTALDVSFFSGRGIKIASSVPPLGVQLNWFSTYLRSVCSTPTECANKLNSSLVFVGEIGYNDIGYALLQGSSIQMIESYVPLVNQVIINTTREVIKAGASQVVVPGIFPLGCFPFALDAASINDPADYDDLGCLKTVNNLVSLHNNGLQEALISLREELPDAVILYADYYCPFQSLLREAPAIGFDGKALFKPCCGGSDTPACGSPGAPVCSNPNQYIHWDGVHLTQEAYRRITEILLKDLRIKCTP